MKSWACLLAAAALLCAGAARAEVWGYVDDRGVAHFAPEKLDGRYELFFRGGESFDTAEGVKTPREPVVPRGPGGARLLAFFEVSPAFRSVQPHLRDAAREHGIDFELLQALVATESGFDPAAVSPKGAIGLMQVLPATAERYGVTGDRRQPVEQKLTDPRTNIRAGARYLRDLIRMFPGRIELALAAYNAGEGAVQRAGNRVPDYRETQNYVRTVMQLYTTLKPPQPAPPAAVPNRVRMELPGRAPGAVPRGGAIGRGNVPLAAGAASLAPPPAVTASQP
ncbi:MAG TPA: lytic transglycosylase domain-containing protein [Ramlibacter sp.]|nr:lytic transglycosylase domain-containing protein [Ramlibacter sp.]